MRRKLLVDDGAEFDDSNDETYLPSHTSTSDTDTDTGSHNVPIRKKQKISVRDTNWKRKSTKLKVRRTTHRKSPSRKDSCAKAAKQLREKILLLQSRRKKSLVSETEKAKKLSKIHEKTRSIIRKAHVARLDSLLASNELKRLPIFGDGNCFFTAVKLSGGIKEGTDVMRSQLCDFIKTNPEKYRAFWANKASGDDSDFFAELENLFQSGVWNTNMADILPMAVADFYRSVIRIYTSAIATPVINIKPDIETEKITNIAYITVRGEEHYDATTTIVADKTEAATNNDSASIPPTNQTETESADESVQTPHKRAAYRSPGKQLSSRKRKRNPEKWKKNIRKSKKTQGQEYFSVSGKVQAAKSVKPHSCGNCKFKCGEKFTEEERQLIFEFYYNLNNYERQRQFICEMVDRESSSRRGKGKRQISQKYHLVKDDKKVRICRDFFMKTLDIKRKTIDYNVSKKKHGAFGGQDMRGRHKAPNKTEAERISFVEQHIASFPRMESHYSRQSTKKQYLQHDLNIKKMWKLYSDLCEKEGKVPVSEAMYRKTFCEKFNLSFFKPKKDQCSTCALYDRKRAAGTLDETLEREYALHQEEKEIARQEKTDDKERARTDKSVYAATFDLQAVLTTPCSLVSELYYSRKLCCYNLTVYSLGDKQVHCHVWDETQGKRGSCEIATCLMKDTTMVCQSPDIKEIVYFSDSCGGQNRNKFVTASHLFAITQQPQLQRISHKFLVSGHSQMECDSVHASIETTKKITPVFVPSHWNTLIALSRKQNPYIAVPMKFNHVVDFKDFVQKHCKNLKTTTTGTRINWLNVKWIEVRQSNPRSVFVNYTFDRQEFQEIQVQMSTRQRVGRALKWPESYSQLQLCYTSKLPISIAKKKDLVSLCEREIIPQEFHSYYASLPESKTEKDFVPFDSDEEDTDIE